MQVIITEDRNHAIKVTEYLEPNFASYSIEQGNNKILIDEYQLGELIRTLNFINRC